jgi:hypothetical protein
LEDLHSSDLDLVGGGGRLVDIAVEYLEMKKAN